MVVTQIKVKCKQKEHESKGLLMYAKTQETEESALQNTLIYGNS